MDAGGRSNGANVGKDEAEQGLEIVQEVGNSGEPPVVTRGGKHTRKKSNSVTFASDAIVNGESSEGKSQEPRNRAVLSKSRSVAYRINTTAGVG